MQSLYVFPVEGKPVQRYGTNVLIGATRSAKGRGNTIVWTPDVVVHIPPEEFAKYGREYRRALESGSLKRASAADWAAQNATPPTKKKTSKTKVKAPPEERKTTE